MASRADRSRPESRGLTDREAVIIGSLLADRPVPERDRSREVGVPSRTFEDVRRRAYERGWVYHRYLPNPLLVGRQKVTFALVQPFAEATQATVEGWRGEKAAVVVWHWPETIFGVFFHSDASDSPLPFLHGSISSSSKFRDVFALSCDVRGPGIPVYFDHSAAWARFTTLHEVDGYPRGLSTRGAGDLPPSLRQRAIHDLSTFLTASAHHLGASGPRRFSSHFLRPSERRMLANGLVERRVFLGLKQLPSYLGHRIESVVFVRGGLVEGARPEHLFRRMRMVGLSPFLFATDGVRVMSGALSPAPPTEDGSPARPPVLANLQKYLRNIVITRERLDSLSIIVDHHYDRLFSAE